MLPDQPGAHPHLLVNLGKGQAGFNTLAGGVIYLTDRDNLGGYNTTSDNVVQRLAVSHGELGVPAYWNGNVYFWPGASEPLWQYSLTNGLLSNTPVAVSTETPPASGHTANPVISANGNSTAIVWSIDTSTTQPILRAHDATNVATTLYSSTTNASRDTVPGLSVAFASPTVANGKVYVGANRWVSVYGLLTTPSFTLESWPYTMTLTQGNSASSTVAVVPASGFTGSVTLVATGLPSGVTASFATNPTTGNSLLTLTASATAPAATSTVTITGTSGSLTATTTIGLTVGANPSFALSDSPSTVSLTQGSSGSTTVKVTPANGFTGGVTLAASGLPSGVTASFGTNPTLLRLQQLFFDRLGSG